MPEELPPPEPDSEWDLPELAFSETWHNRPYRGQTIANPTTNANPSMEKLKQLKELLDMGLISQADFDSKKNEILSQM